MHNKIHFPVEQLHKILYGLLWPCVKTFRDATQARTSIAWMWQHLLKLVDYIAWPVQVQHKSRLEPIKRRGLADPCDIFELLRPAAIGEQPSILHTSTVPMDTRRKLQEVCVLVNQTNSGTALACSALDWDTERHLKYFKWGEGNLALEGTSVELNGIVLAKVQKHKAIGPAINMVQVSVAPVTAGELLRFSSAYFLQLTYIVIASSWSCSVWGQSFSCSCNWERDLPLYSKLSCCGGLLCVYFRFLASTWTNGNWIRS